MKKINGKFNWLWSYQSSLPKIVLLSAIAALLLSLFMNAIHLMSALNLDLQPPRPGFLPKRSLNDDFFLRFIFDGFLFTFLVGFSLFFINLIPNKQYKYGLKTLRYAFKERVIICIILVILFQLLHFWIFDKYFLLNIPRGDAPGLLMEKGKLPFENGSGFVFRINGMIITKNLSLLIIALLFGEMLRLFIQQQKSKLEIERIKKENIQTQYNAIAAQMNPHFFFNSLNSLSALVREGNRDSALKYIEELSVIFRYVLKSSQKGLVPLEEEMDFLNAYKFLLGIRFEGKLFFNIEKDCHQAPYALPVLSLQPLIENAIKHNVISIKTPLIVNIGIAEDYLIVSNVIKPKVDYNQIKGGFGLKNLFNRVKILTGKDLIVTQTSEVFEVRIPLIKQV